MLPGVSLLLSSCTGGGISALAWMAGGRCSGPRGLLGSPGAGAGHVVWVVGLEGNVDHPLAPAIAQTVGLGRRGASPFFVLGGIPGTPPRTADTLLAWFPGGRSYSKTGWELTTIKSRVPTLPAVKASAAGRIASISRHGRRPPNRAPRVGHPPRSGNRSGDLGREGDHREFPHRYWGR